MKAPVTDKHLLELMWDRFPEIMKRGVDHLAQQEPLFKPLIDLHPGLAEELKAINTSPQPAQQEPVATAYFEKITGRIVPPDDTHRRKFPMCYRPLVFGDTSQPAQRTWVGLTDEERAKAIHANFGTGLWSMAKDVEAKLKEKNT